MVSEGAKAHVGQDGDTDLRMMRCVRVNGSGLARCTDEVTRVMWLCSTGSRVCVYVCTCVRVCEPTHSFPSQQRSFSSSCVIGGQRSIQLLTNIPHTFSLLSHLICGAAPLNQSTVHNTTTLSSFQRTNAQPSNISSSKLRQEDDIMHRIVYKWCGTVRPSRAAAAAAATATTAPFCYATAATELTSLVHIIQQQHHCTHGQRPHPLSQQLLSDTHSLSTSTLVLSCLVLLHSHTPVTVVPSTLPASLLLSLTQNVVLQSAVPASEQVP